MNGSMRDATAMRRAGGVAALYLAAALLAAMPYFLLVVDYPGATTVAAKVTMIVGNYASMYGMYLATYVAFGMALGVVALALYDRLADGAPVTARLATAAGLLWSVALVASGLVFTYGMTSVVRLAQTDVAQARVAWQGLEPIALALGGAGGEVLGGVWALLTGVAIVRSGALPKALGWLGVGIGAVGILSVVPLLGDAAMLFGVLQIVWLAWLGMALLGVKAPSIARRSARAAAA